ncbi:MAG: site-2 protease family protein, partial [Acidobacteriota bacterium]|nr:site-2 protease family protein [Acidobacteriota bacterium]
MELSQLPGHGLGSGPRTPGSLGHDAIRRPDPSATAGNARYWLAGLLLAVTFFTATTLGAVFWVSTQTDVTTSLVPLLSPGTIASVWRSPELLETGLTFSIPLLLILFAHEMGHFLVCRRYGLPTTAPFFLPAPFGLGTLGAFIRIRAPLRHRKELLDVGAGGPIAGFVVLLPLLAYGISQSSPARLLIATPEKAVAALYLPGESLVIQWIGRLLHGELPPDTVLNLHPVALAAWAGLLATSINLLPIGQLDGGHILYAAAGRYQHLTALAVWLLMIVGGFSWPGWWLLALLVLVFGLRHPPVHDESLELDPRRLAIAILSLLIFLLSFAPRPIAILPVADTEPGGLV